MEMKIGGIRRPVLAGLAALALLAGAAPASARDENGRVSEGDSSEMSEQDLARNGRLDLPARCSRRNLRPQVQRICDRIRFQGEPHFNLVRLTPGGVIRSIQLIETETGRVALRGYPYGTSFAVPGPGDREVRVPTKLLKSFVRGRPTPGSSQAVAQGDGSPGPSNAFATGQPIGWNPSTGATTGQCFNFTIFTPTEGPEQTTFSSTGAASSTAAQTNTSATIKGSYEGFSTSDSFSYSDAWQNSSFSGNQYYNFYVLYTLDTTFVELNTSGRQALNTGAFSTLCGSQFMASVTAGMIATISINYSSTSASTASSIANTFTFQSPELASLQTAVSVANSASDSISNFSISMIISGGGQGALAALNEAFATQDPTTQTAYYIECGTPGPTAAAACGQFSSNMGQGASNALTSFENEIAGLDVNQNPDIAFLSIFPSGVAGAPSILIAEDLPIQANPGDLLAPYAGALTTYETLLNQIATLSNRAVAVSQRIGCSPPITTNPPCDTTAFTPPPTFLEPGNFLLDLQADVYNNDRAVLLTNLATCLQASTANVASACQPITDNSDDNITTAYAYYAPNGPNPNFLAQQNTIALQYTGAYTNTNNSSWPMDVAYINPLPIWSNVNQFVLIGNQAALVGFADGAFINGGVTQMLPSLAFLPLQPDADLADVTTAVYTTQGTQPPGLWFSWYNQNPGPGTNAINEPMVWMGTTTSCAPTFTFPCSIGYGLQSGVPDFPLAFQMTQITGLFVPD